MGENPLLSRYPHLVLGAPATSTIDDVSVAFAVASRRLKQNPDSGLTTADLTSALAEIENKRPGAFRMHYRAPADVSLYERALSQGGPEPELALLRQAFEELFQWHWTAAAELTKSILASSKDESIRDEALNVLAAAQVMQGDPAKALSALQQAVQGQWNEELQVNLAIVALECDSEIALKQAQFLIQSAKSGEERSEAFGLALQMLSQWLDAQGVNSESDETHDQAVFKRIPREMRDVIRNEFITTTDPATFWQLGVMINNLDKVWLRDGSTMGLGHNFSKSVFYHQLPGKLYRARYLDQGQFLPLLIENISNSEPWFVEVADESVDFLIRALEQEEVEPELLQFASVLLNAGLKIDSPRRLLFKYYHYRELAIVSTVQYDQAPGEEIMEPLWSCGQPSDEVGLTEEGLVVFRGMMQAFLGHLGKGILALRNDQTDSILKLARKATKGGFLSSVLSSGERATTKQWCDTVLREYKWFHEYADADEQPRWDELRRWAMQVKNTVGGK